MMDSAYVLEQNKIASSGAWIWLLEINTVGYLPNPTLRYTNNNALGLGETNKYYTTWPTGGSQYWTVPFTMDDISASTDGKFPEYKLMIEDVALDSTLRTRIKATAGLTGSTIRLMVVHSAHLDLTTPAIDELTEILSCELTANAVVFTLGIPSLLSRRFPRDRYVPTFCRHKFEGALCQYVMPTNDITGEGFTLTSSQVSFIPIAGSIAGERYNTIWVNDKELITHVFRHTPGQWDISADEAGIVRTRYALTNDTAFQVSGSKSNDGWFIANKYHAVGQQYVRVFVEDDGGRAFETEAAGNLITIQLGFDNCDHTLEACRLRNNSQNYGGSPGIAGGVYG